MASPDVSRLPGYLGVEDDATGTWARKVHRKLHQVPGNQRSSDSELLGSPNMYGHICINVDVWIISWMKGINDIIIIIIC